MATAPIILGTAGHIDHGKSSLIKALTGVDPDRLKEEKLRGITIELGFADLVLPNGRHLGIVDVPGHERFVRHMVAGATGMDLVALVIAADEGVMPQTREHLEICQLLQVKQGLVVLTKTDMVEEDWLELVEEEVREALKGTFLEEAPIRRFSSVTLAGKDELLATLAELAEQVPPKPFKGIFRLPIDRVFTIKGFGTVVTGTAISGRLKSGRRWPSIRRSSRRGCAASRCTARPWKRPWPATAPRSTSRAWKRKKWSGAWWWRPRAPCCLPGGWTPSWRSWPAPPGP